MTRRIRIKAADGTKRTYGQVKAALGGGALRVLDQGSGTVFVVEGDEAAHIDAAQSKLAQAGLEIDDPPKTGAKPYGFVALPEKFEMAELVWHDGTGSEGRLSGEVRFELRTLTPMLVGWERQKIGELSESARLPEEARGCDSEKALLCPLRAPWHRRPVIIPGDTLKGLLRHELGALLGAPMERVAERSYSYRPNLSYPLNTSGRRLEPRLARVVSNASRDSTAGLVNVPTEVEVLPLLTRQQQRYFPPPAPNIQAEPYRGGVGAGTKLPSDILPPEAQNQTMHTSVDVGATSGTIVPIPPSVQEDYLATIAHLLDGENGHFSNRYPNIGNNRGLQQDTLKIVREGCRNACQVNDLIWVELDTGNSRVISFGWHYYYRWSYQDTVRTVRRGGNRSDRHGLTRLEEEKQSPPEKLSAVRRLFGYIDQEEDNGRDVDDDNNRASGRDDASQLMGRISINAAVEAVADGESDHDRFLPPTFLKELGMPRPSAVEYYLKQPFAGGRRPSDTADLMTYGDAAGIDEPGEIAGRKFYLDRADAYQGTPWQAVSQGDCKSKHGTLAIEASKGGRTFRFTLRFRDLDPGEFAATLLALCPNQFAGEMGGDHEHGYCSKLGYARPLGWGSVAIEAKQLFFIVEENGKPALKPEDVSAWFTREKGAITAADMSAWLSVHRHKHPDAKDYQRSPTRDGPEIFAFHTGLRAEHSRKRRYGGN